jgi:hypothetical protein
LPRSSGSPSHSVECQASLYGGSRRTCAKPLPARETPLLRDAEASSASGAKNNRTTPAESRRWAPDAGTRRFYCRRAFRQVQECDAKSGAFSQDDLRAGIDHRSSMAPSYASQDGADDRRPSEPDPLAPCSMAALEHNRQRQPYGGLTAAQCFAK